MTTITPTKSKALFTYLQRHKIPIFILLANILIISSLLAIRSSTGITIDELTRDPLAIVDKPFYLGMFSNLGILLWCAAAAICLFTGSLLKKYSNNRTYSFLLSSGILTSILMFDDLFLLHEDVIPKYLEVRESHVQLIYLIIVALYLVKYRKIVAKTYLIPLLMSIVFFALSIAWDRLPVSMLYEEVLFEDGFKLSGIVSWLVYFIVVSKEQLKMVLNTPRDTI